jgi:hypothetical protein
MGEKKRFQPRTFYLDEEEALWVKKKADALNITESAFMRIVLRIILNCERGESSSIASLEDKLRSSIAPDDIQKCAD